MVMGDRSCTSQQQNLGRNKMKIGMKVQVTTSNLILNWHAQQCNLSSLT